MKCYDEKLPSSLLPGESPSNCKCCEGGCTTRDLGGEDEVLQKLGPESMLDL